MAKFKKQQFGHPNPIFVHEERALLAVVDRADEASTNSQIIGRNGELALLAFLNRYLPQTMRALNGHFVTPSGDISPENDLMVIDTRYPLIAQNEDGSVLAMLHSVIGTIEVKRTLTKSENLKIRKNATAINNLQSQVFGDNSEYGSLLQLAFAYRTSIKIDTIEKHFFADWESAPPLTALEVLRIVDSDAPKNDNPFGVRIWLETGDLPSYVTTVSPLSDFYYNLVLDANYTLGARDYDFHDVGAHMLNYMTWGTYPNNYTEHDG
ncbi:MAG: hypothetical protein Aurels2KO_53250 [Aureliella sp.]